MFVRARVWLEFKIHHFLCILPSTSLRRNISAKFRVLHVRHSDVVEQIVARAGRDLERSDGDDDCHTVCVKTGLG